MCGIAGFIDFNNTSSEEMLSAMSNALVHRGPDGNGVFFKQATDCQIGLAHRRLAIIDLSETGKQPMQYGHLQITFNGEIYNYAEIKKELIALQHQFMGHSDTEMMLHAFAEWGIACIDKFIGMFAFVIYDTEKQELYCVRDRAGVKPLFYYWKDNLFLFASELKAFYKHPHFTKELDRDAIAAFMQYGNVPSPHCIFKHSYKLAPGHFLKFTINKATFSIHQYWNVYNYYNKPKSTLSFNEAKIKTESILQSAFEYRMIADVPVGVFLSGGYDSACVTALLQKNNTEKLKTFTIAVPDIGLNEAPYAKEVATHLGTDHHEFTCSEKEAFDIITELPYYYDEPFADSSAIPTKLVCKMAKQQVTVALSADAGDEIFAGYNRYDYILKYGSLLNNIPGIVKKGIAASMAAIPATAIPYFKNTYNFANRYDKIKNLLQDSSPQHLLLNLSRQYNALQLKEVFAQPFSELETAYSSKELNELFFSPLSYMMAIDYQTYLADDILQKVDRASMSVSLEGREPFLDHRIIEWAAQLPDNYKYHKGIKKHIIKEIVHQYIPQALIDRPKMGFAIPIENWLSSQLKEQVLHYLSDELILEQGIFSLPYIQTLKTNFFAGKKEWHVKVWYVLMFQLWYERNMN